MRKYENYHIHSDYSNIFFLDSPIERKAAYAKRAKELGQTVLSSCEHGYAGNFLEVYDTAVKNELKFVFAAELYWVKDRLKEYEAGESTQRDRTNNHIVLIAKNRRGLLKINSMISEANDSGYYYRPRIDLEMLLSIDPSDVMVTTACIAFYGYGLPESEEIILKLWRHFGDSFYLELQSHLIREQKEINAFILKLYRKYGIRVIAGCDSHFIYPEQKSLRTDLQSSTLRGIDEDPSDELFMDYPDGDELFNRFVRQGIVPEAIISEAIENTNIIATFDELTFSRERKIPNPYKHTHPEYTESDRLDIYKDLIKSAWNKYKEGVPKEKRKEYVDAIMYEMDTMIGGGVSDYPLLNYEIVQGGLARGGVISKSGRGSGPSHFTNTLLGFSTMDRISLPVKMFPDRFVSKSRLLAGQLPDLDLNVADRTPFVDSAKDVLGEEHVYPMIAFGTAKKKQAWKMYCRSYNAGLKDGEVPIDPDTMNAMSSQLEKYDLAVKHKEDEDEEIDIEDYVSEEFLDLYKKSELFWGLITGKTVHPCALLTYDGSIREEIGLIRAKSDSGKLDELVTVIDGVTADKYGFVKTDILKVAVYDLIDRIYKEIGIETPSTNDLLKMVDGDNATWRVFIEGLCCGVNQCEKSATKERLMRYKPKNLSELSAFVAAIRPGFKSNLETFLSRQKFEYGIPEFDEIIQTKYITSSFLLYQENIMSALGYAGFPQAECYTILKYIAKKHPEDIAKVKPVFMKGFAERCGEDNAERVWQIISDASNYAFNASHSTAVAFDALYVAWAKAHYPLKTHKAMLETYSKKGDKARLGVIKAEMYSGFDIKLKPPELGDDNTSYAVDEDSNLIIDAMFGIPYLNRQVADEFAKLPAEGYDLWVDFLTGPCLNTSANKRQIETLIKLGYFRKFGSIKKLLYLYSEFKTGKNKYSATYTDKTKEKRISLLRELETKYPDEGDGIYDLVQNQTLIIGSPAGTITCPQDVYIVTEIEVRHNAKVQLYSLARGTTGALKIKKDTASEYNLKKGDIIQITYWRKKPRYRYNGPKIKATKIQGAFDKWICTLDMIQKAPETEEKDE